MAKQKTRREGHVLERNVEFGSAVTQSPAMEVVFEIQLQTYIKK